LIPAFSKMLLRVGEAEARTKMGLDIGSNKVKKRKDRNICQVFSYLPYRIFVSDSCYLELR
jgi:hypothetical protein